MKNYPSENRRKFIKEASKIVHEWNVNVEIFSYPRAKKILGNICFSQQIFHRKQSLGAPVCSLVFTRNCQFLCFFAFSK